MFSNSELMSSFKIHLKYTDDIKYWDQQRVLERAPEEIAKWPHSTILHFSMIVASQGNQTGEYTSMQSPQAWKYKSELMHRPQSCGYQSELMHRPQSYGYQSELMHRPQSYGYQSELMHRPQYQSEELDNPQSYAYQAELMQRLQIGLNSCKITLLPSFSSFPTLKGKFRNRPSWGDKRRNGHAEQLLMEKLYVYFSFFANQIEASGQVLNVQLEITQNYSPCEDCAAKLKDFIYICRQRYHCDVNISITFATFYKFYRFYSRKGLVKLLKAGVQLHLINDDLREKIQTLLIEAYNIHEETMKTWVQERKRWDDFYMNKINDECSETSFSYVWIVVIIIIVWFIRFFT